MRKFLIAASALAILAAPMAAIAKAPGNNPTTISINKTVTSINSGSLADSGASLGGNGYEASTATNTGKGTTTGNVSNAGGVNTVNTTTSSYDTGAVQAHGNGAATASEAGQISTGFTSFSKVKTTTTGGFDNRD